MLRVDDVANASNVLNIRRSNWDLRSHIFFVLAYFCPLTRVATGGAAHLYYFLSSVCWLFIATLVLLRYFSSLFFYLSHASPAAQANACTLKYGVSGFPKRG